MSTEHQDYMMYITLKKIINKMSGGTNMPELPYDIISNIFNQSELNTQANLSVVCKEFRGLKISHEDVFTFLTNEIKKKLENTNVKATITMPTDTFTVTTVFSISQDTGVYISPDFLLNQDSVNMYAIKFRGPKNNLGQKLLDIKKMLTDILKLNLPNGTLQFLTPPQASQTSQAVGVSQASDVNTKEIKEYFNFQEMRGLLESSDAILAIRALDNPHLPYLQYVAWKAEGGKIKKARKKENHRKSK